MRAINLLRKEHDLSIKDFCEVLGISESYFKAIAYGDRNVSLKLIKAIRKAFPDTDIERFITYDD